MGSIARGGYHIHVPDFYINSYELSDKYHTIKYNIYKFILTHT